MLYDIKENKDLCGLYYTLLNISEEKYKEILLEILDSKYHYIKGKNICIFHSKIKDLSKTLTSFKQDFLIKDFNVYSGKYRNYKIFLFAYEKFKKMVIDKKISFLDENLHGIIEEVDENFKKKILNNIYKNDKMYSLINTFCKCGLNGKKTSEILGMHRNTLSNKIKDIKNITGYDIRDFEDAMILYLCVK